jgi:hypothetical protein
MQASVVDKSRAFGREDSQLSDRGILVSLIISTEGV